MGIKLFTCTVVSYIVFSVILLSPKVYIGCSSDILTELDLRCSGQNSCMISVPDSILHKKQPCPQDMMAYLEASYTCTKGKINITLNRFLMEEIKLIVVVLK